MKNILTFIIIFLSIATNAQPGYENRVYNITDLPKYYSILNKKYPDIYGLSIVVDSTSKDFAKLVLLKTHNELIFDIRVKKLPQEFNSIIFDSINKVSFFCNNITTDLSNIIGFKKTKEIIINEYKGANVPKILNQFYSLQSLFINESKHLKNIDALRDLKKLKLLSIDCSNLNKFPTFSKDNPLGHIILKGVHNNLNFKNLNSLKNLGGIEINIPKGIKEFPDYLTRNLRQIKINGNILSLSNLTIYPNVEYLRIVSIILKKFDIDFSNNEKIKNIAIVNSPKLKNIDAIYTCKNLEYLLLNGLPSIKEFDLKGLNLKKGLSIQATGITVIEPIEKIRKLSYLYICHNDYLNFEMEKKKSNQTIFNNGRLIRK